jgi:transketolase
MARPREKPTYHHESRGRTMSDTTTTGTLDQICVNTIRTLSMDAVQKANSGHPGLPMGAADVAYVLWTQFLKHNPANPSWPKRDRFVLSGGHGSMLLYSLLHLTGYDLPLEELMNFRQWDSRTPGHPEYGLTPGVETTTGPLGQGFANGVGMAIAERFLAETFNRPGYQIVDNHTYAIVTDGDLMEGISHEAASLAGHLGLGKLIYLYDDNHISIDGPTDLTFTEDRCARFQAYGWHVQQVDGHHREAIARAIRAAQAETERPSFIACRTHIAFGSPNKQDTAASHGAPLGEEEVRLAKQNLGWPSDAQFYIPDEALARFRQAVNRGEELEKEWTVLFDRYAAEYPDLVETWKQVWSGELPAGWEEQLPSFTPEDGPVATRSVSGKVLNAVAPVLPTLVGGSADLTPSNNTELKESPWLQAGKFGGRNIHYGVREHAMSSIMNGLALYGGVIPYGGTFLVFSDYMRPAIRLAALMELPVIYVFTHDSIALGEDGPTHQPVEHLPSLRTVPKLVVLRPADATETVESWRVALEHHEGPVALLLTRQKLPVLDRSALPSAEGVGRGAYVLVDSEGTPDVILIASGSEVEVALDARQRLAEQNVKARVVSMPSWELFEQQPPEYRDEVLPPEVSARLAIEMAAPMGWERYVGLQGDVVGINRFGASAPYQVLLEQFGFTGENVALRALAVLDRTRR